MKSKNKFTRVRPAAASIPIPTHDEIRVRATTIWHGRGRVEGQDTEIWLEAESQLFAEAERKGRALGAHQTIFDEDRKPTHEVEKHLAEIVLPASDRSPTSL